jgi:hypothetical protein
MIIKLFSDKYYLLQGVTDIKTRVNYLFKFKRVKQTPDKVTIYVGSIGYIKLNFSKISRLNDCEEEMYKIRLRTRKDLPVETNNFIVIDSFDLPDKYSASIRGSNKSGGVRCKLLIKETRGCI